jgi:hypothetical protein
MIDIDFKVSDMDASGLQVSFLGLAEVNDVPDSVEILTRHVSDIHSDKEVNDIHRLCC